MASTRAGWLDGKEVVEVVFDPGITPYAKLLERARCVKDPATAYVYDQTDLPAARKVVGDEAVLTRAAARPAEVTDRKYYLRATPFHLLPLTEVQAARINAMLADPKQDRDPRIWLSPSQRELLAEIGKRFAGHREQLGELRPARDPAQFQSYIAALRRALAKL